MFKNFWVGTFRSIFSAKTQKDESEIESLQIHELFYAYKSKGKQTLKITYFSHFLNVNLSFIPHCLQNQAKFPRI